MVTYKEADQHLIDLAQELIEEHHPWLKEAKIGLMYRSEAIENGNVKMIGHARKVSEEMKVFMDFDFLIWVAEDVFSGYSPIQRRALVDHELCHCGGMDGEWKIRKHDFEEFHKIVQWYGMWSDSLKVAQQALDQPELPGVKVQIERHSGMVSSVPADLLERASSNSAEFSAELVTEAQKLANENGGKLRVSFLQRELRIGFYKAAKILEIIEKAEERARLGADEGNLTPTPSLNGRGEDVAEVTDGDD